MPDLSKFKHPAYVGYLVPIGIAIASTFPIGTVRGFLLVLFVVSATWTYHITFAERRKTHTGIASIAILVVAAVVFAYGRSVDTASKPKPPAPVPPTEVNSSPGLSAVIPKSTKKREPKRKRPSQEFTSETPKDQPSSSLVGNDNTIVNAPVPSSLGNGNTIIGPTDGNGNTIYNKGGTAIGNGACADKDGIALGAHANGNCANDAKQQPKK